MGSPYIMSNTILSSSRNLSTLQTKQSGPNNKAQCLCYLSLSTKQENHKAEQIRQTINTRLTQNTTNIAASGETASLQSKWIFGEMPSSKNRLEMLSSNSASQRGSKLCKSEWLKTAPREAERSDQPWLVIHQSCWTIQGEKTPPPADRGGGGPHGHLTNTHKGKRWISELQWNTIPWQKAAITLEAADLDRGGWRPALPFGHWDD